MTTTETDVTNAMQQKILERVEALKGDAIDAVKREGGTVPSAYLFGDDGLEMLRVDMPDFAQAVTPHVQAVRELYEERTAAGVLILAETYDTDDGDASITATKIMATLLIGGMGAVAWAAPVTRDVSGGVTVGQWQAVGRTGNANH